MMEIFLLLNGFMRFVRNEIFHGQRTSHNSVTLFYKLSGRTESKRSHKYERIFRVNDILGTLHMLVYFAMHMQYGSWKHSWYSHWLLARGSRVVVQVPVGSKIFTYPYLADWFWDPSTLLSNGCGGIFPQG
jgi:hypothetical protein